MQQHGGSVRPSSNFQSKLPAEWHFCEAVIDDAGTLCPKLIVPLKGMRYCYAHKRECYKSVSFYKEAFHNARAVRDGALTGRQKLKDIRTLKKLDAAIRASRIYNHWVKIEMRQRIWHATRFRAHGTLFPYAVVPSCRP